MKSVTVSGNNTKQFQGQGRVQGSARNNKNQRESQAVGVTENIRLIVATLNTNTRWGKRQDRARTGQECEHTTGLYWSINPHRATNWEHKHTNLRDCEHIYGWFCWRLVFGKCHNILSWYWGLTSDHRSGGGSNLGENIMCKMNYIYL